MRLSPKRARRFSHSSDGTSNAQAVSSYLVGTATEVTTEAKPSRPRQAKKPPPDAQPVAAEDDLGASIAAGVIRASRSVVSSSAHMVDTPSSQLAVMTFPAQLLSLLQRDVASDALWWFEEGRAIGINRKLIDNVLNEHFRGMKFNSLVRNLNRW